MSLTSPTGGQGGGSSSSSGGSPRLLPLLDIPTILASSSNTHFDRAPLAGSVVRLKGRTFGTIADAITNPPTTWTLVNSARLTSAAASGDSIVLTHLGSGAADILYNGVATAAHYKRSLGGAPFTPCRHFRVFHLAGTVAGASTSIFAGIIDSNNQWIARADLFNTAGTFNIRAITASTALTTIASRTAGELLTGTWWKLVADEHTRVAQVYYSHGSYASGEPTSWTLAVSGTAWPATGTFLDTYGVERQAAGTGPVGTISGWRSYREPTLSALTGLQDNWNSLGYAATSDAILLADLDYGTAGGLPDQATIRLALADAVNRYPAEAATWTFSFTGSDSASPAAATTYQSAAALVLKAPSSDTTVSTAKRYWRLRAIATSTSSIQAGSIDLSRIPGVYAVAT